MNILNRTTEKAIYLINNIKDAEAEEVIQTLKDLSYFIQLQDSNYCRSLYGHLYRKYENWIYLDIDTDDWNTIKEHNEHGTVELDNEYSGEWYVENGGIRVSVKSKFYGDYFDDLWEVYYVDSGKVLHKEQVKGCADDMHQGYFTDVPSEVNFYVCKYFFRELEGFAEVPDRIVELERKSKALKGFGNKSNKLTAEIDGMIVTLKEGLSIWQEDNKLWLESEKWEKIYSEKDIPKLPF